MTFTPAIDKRIIIKEAWQLSWTLRSDTEYLIDGEIDLGTNTIAVPSGGLTMVWLWFNISKLYSTQDNYTMFNGGGTSWNIALRWMEISASWLNSKLFNINNNWNNGAAEFLDCNIGSFSRLTTSFGNFDNYRQLRFDGCGFINYSDWFTLNWTFNGWVAVTDSIILSSQSWSTLFKEGTSFVMNGSSISNINASSWLNNANSVVWDFQESNIASDEWFVLDSARFGSLVNPLPNLDSGSTKTFFRSCVGIDNTFIWWIWQLTTEAATTIAIGTITKLAWTTTYKALEHFSSNWDNSLVYNSTIQKDFVITWTAVLSWGLWFAWDSVTLTIRKWDDSLSAYENLDEYTKIVPNSVGVAEVLDIAFFSYATLNQNDRIELWVTNNSWAADITLSTSSFLKMSTRT